jgi:hypothetical protein
MRKLPKEVTRVQQQLSRDPSHELFHIAEKLIKNTPDLVAMWNALKRPAEQDDLWVWGFLRAVESASALPPYHYVRKRERDELSEKITKLATKLSQALVVNKLDGHLIHNKGKIFNGFLLYEDFGESNQAGIDDDDLDKLKISTLITEFAERATSKIKETPTRGKSAKNVMAIRFIRLLAERNSQWYQYGKPLNSVVATATNAMYKTDYSASDVTNLLTR